MSWNSGPKAHRAINNGCGLRNLSTGLILINFFIGKCDRFAFICTAARTSEKSRKSSSPKLFRPSGKPKRVSSDSICLFNTAILESVHIILSKFELKIIRSDENVLITLALCEMKKCQLKRLFCTRINCEFFTDTKPSEEDEDYSASISAIMLRRQSTKRRGSRVRRSSSPYSLDPFQPETKRRSSVHTNSSGESVNTIIIWILEIKKDLKNPKSISWNTFYICFKIWTKSPKSVFNIVYKRVSVVYAAMRISRCISKSVMSNIDK